MLHGKLTLLLYGAHQLESLGLSPSIIIPSGNLGYNNIRIDLIVSSWIFEEGDGCWEETDWNLRIVEKDWIYLSTINNAGKYVIVGIRPSEVLGFKQRA